VFSGQDVFAHRVVAHGGAVTPPEDLPWLPELLSQAGVQTYAVDNLERWFRRGFTRYAPFPLAASPDGYWRKADAVLAAARPVLAVLRSCARDNTPFFAFFHFWDPHTPYCPPPPFDRLYYDGNERRADQHGLDALWAFSPFSDYFAGWMPGVTDPAFPRAQYAACATTLDQGVQRLWHELAAAGCLEDTLVILVADHGECLGEHGVWFDHHGLYHENLHVPLVLWAPGRVPAGRTYDGPVTLLDIAPTILGAMGVPVADAMAGRDLAAMWRGELAELGPLYGTECTWQRKRFWREGDWKLISALEPDFHGGPDLELYNLRRDPGETANLVALEPARTRRMLDRLERHVARRVAATGRPDPLRTQPVVSRRIGAPVPPRQAAQPVSAEDRERVSRRLANLGY
jgi:arylsulfatase A-like enzyme